MQEPDIKIRRVRGGTEISGGSLSVPVVVKWLNNGYYTRVYGTKDTVYLIVPHYCNDKEILREAWRRAPPAAREFLPELHKIGSNEHCQVYQTKRLVPLTRDNRRLVTKINNRLNSLRREVKRPLDGYTAADVYGHSLSVAFLEILKGMSVPADLLDALHAVVDAASAFGKEHGLELAVRNWMQDPKTGQLNIVDPTLGLLW